METDRNPIPFRMTVLIVGYFQRTITESEQTELDDWIIASEENRRAFEECLEVTLHPHHANELDKSVWETEGPAELN